MTYQRLYLKNIYYIMDYRYLVSCTVFEVQHKNNFIKPINRHWRCNEIYTSFTAHIHGTVWRFYDTHVLHYTNNRSNFIFIYLFHFLLTAVYIDPFIVQWGLLQNWLNLFISNK